MVVFVSGHVCCELVDLVVRFKEWLGSQPVLLFTAPHAFASRLIHFRLATPRLLRVFVDLASRLFALSLDVLLD